MIYLHHKICNQTNLIYGFVIGSATHEEKSWHEIFVIIKICNHTFSIINNERHLTIHHFYLSDENII